MRADRETDRQSETDILITILRTTPEGEVMTVCAHTTLVVFLHQCHHHRQQQQQQLVFEACAVRWLYTGALQHWRHARAQLHRFCEISVPLLQWKSNSVELNGLLKVVIYIMRSAVYLAVVFLAIVLPVSCEQATKPHAWMPQGRFGKRTSQQSDGTAAAIRRALLSGKYCTESKNETWTSFRS